MVLDAKDDDAVAISNSDIANVDSSSDIANVDSSSSDVHIARAALPGFAPLPTWNGTIAAPPSYSNDVDNSSDGRCSLLCENGEVIVLRATLREHHNRDHHNNDCSTKLRVDKILRAPSIGAVAMGDDAARSVCQCWSTDARVFATAHGRCVTFYSALTSNFTLLRSIELRYCVTSMDIARLQRQRRPQAGPLASSDTADALSAWLLVVGTAFGVHLYELDLALTQPPPTNQDAPAQRTRFAPRASAYTDVAVCVVKLDAANDSQSLSLAIGTVDGRVFIRELLLTSSSSFATMGDEVFAKVLASPRVTSMSFSPDASLFAVATRKGHVYVLARRTAPAANGGIHTNATWELHAPCRALSETPKAPTGAAAAASVAIAAVAMQTLVCWWGSIDAAVLVVASRAVNYAIEMFDAASGALVHTLRMQPQSQLNSSIVTTTTGNTDDELLLGLCCLRIAPRGALQLELATHLDAWSYEQRLRDAASHAASVAREYPIVLVKPSHAAASAAAHAHAHDGRLHFHPYKKSARATSRERFLRQLQRVDSAEYGAVSTGDRYSDTTDNDDAGDSHKHSPSAVDWQPRDPLAVFRERTNALALQLTSTLTKRVQSSSRSSRRVAMPASGRAAATAALHSTPPQSSFAVPLRHAIDDRATRAEIEALEGTFIALSLSLSRALSLTYRLICIALLKDQRLARSAADDFFFRNVADRETNILLDEVVRDLLYDTATDAFHAAERAARVKTLPTHLQQFVDAAMHTGPADRVLIQKFNVGITRRTLQCLRPLQWLNDEVINFYIELLSARDTALVAAGQLTKRSHFFNSFFYTKVSENGYNFSNVRRWTRKIDLFAMDKIFVPVNVSNTHWCMAVIFMTAKRIQYYDSMSGSGTTCLNVLLRYLHDEMQHKKNVAFDATDWTLVTTAPDTPQQANGSDCGVFSCMFADYLSRNEPLSFSQKDMEYHRNRMVLRIVQGELPLEEEEDEEDAKGTGESQEQQDDDDDTEEENAVEEDDEEDGDQYDEDDDDYCEGDDNGGDSGEEDDDDDSDIEIIDG